ncbi:MAG TPA: CapA family protein [Clostridia bacterium]|nr:CapA family protein [Clostridia bacterium]
MKKESRPKGKAKVLSMKNTVIVLFALLLGLTSLMGGCAGGNNLQTTKTDSSQSAMDLQTTESVKADTSVRMMCVGDNLIHSNIYQQAKARAGNGGYDFAFAYRAVEDILKMADFAVLNQETPIVIGKEPSTFPRFNSPPELGEHMRKIGFTVINHANNHVLDQGVTGALKTIEFWKTQEGVLLTGLYSDEDDMHELKLQTVNGIVFAHIGCTEYLNGMRVPDSAELKVISPVGANMTKDEFFRTMKNLIEKAKAKSDVVCVSAHFQQEDSFVPSATQEEIVAKLVAYGADVIIGTGPHVLQPVKFVEGDGGKRALVIYSLGNFISAQSKAANMMSGIADVRFVKSSSTGQTSIVSAAVIPIVTHYTSGYTDVRILPFSDYTPALAGNHGVRKYQAKFDYSYAEDLFNRVIGDDFLYQDWREAA